MINDQASARRAQRLREMTRDLLNDMTPAQRDRMMQIHLAQARGPRQNVLLACQMTSMLLRLEAAKKAGKDSHE
ncbi:MAG: hypothetical protein KAV82_13570 [Phycisphaerae bacterium]|nr:hypothetical protein [Phycisphaerae bacterium]